MESSTTQHASPEISDALGTSELIVILNPCNLACSEFVGTRAMLDAEGFIPAGIQWPAAGFDVVKWKDERFEYQIVRRKPIGAKGQRRLYAECDCWCFRRYPHDAPSAAQRAIGRKVKDLEEEIYRQSALGRSARSKQMRLLSAADADEAFQAFKVLIPGFSQPKRGRRAKASK